MDNRKSFSTFVFAFAMVTLLSCSLVSCYTVPRVTRSHDAIVIDFTGAKSYGQNPGFLNPAFDPYGLFYNGWSHFGRQPAPVPALQTAECGRGPIDFTIPAPPGAGQSISCLSCDTTGHITTSHVGAK